MNGGLTSATSRPLALAMRRDLVVERQRWQGREFWLVKDPLALKYFRFEAEEFAILALLDGRRSCDEICERFEREFAPQRISPKQLQHLAGMLHKSQLVVADAAGQGGALAQRAQEKRRRAAWSAAANLLAFRFRGVDPDRFLTWLDRGLGWIFSLPAAGVFCLLMLSAFTLAASQWETFVARLPTFEAFFAAENWLWLAVTLCLTKVLHELGHGLACKRMGGECHEMGVMLLVFMPCLYCNVSDAWMIPSKWRRAAVGVGGIYVELILASLATFGWWSSAPGLFNSLCLNVMLVSSVSTLVFNANPLMRFDGYYILADLLEIPNLRQKSATIVQRVIGRLIFGLRPRPDPLLPPRHQWLIGLYGAASSVYSWLVSLSIFWLLYRVLEPYGLKAVGQLFGVTILFSLVGVPMVRVASFIWQPLQPKELNPMRAMLGLSIVAGAVAALLLMPLPYYVAARCVIEPRDAASVYVEVPGELVAAHVTNGPVSQGQAVAELDDLDARLKAQQLSNQRTQTVARVESIRQRAHTDDSALLELSQAEEALATLDAQLKRLNEDLAKLVIRSPANGIFYPALARPAEKRDAVQLASWDGRPLERRNLGAYLPASTLLGRVAQPGKLEAILAIPQEELDFVRVNQSVDLLLSSRPGQRLGGQIARISSEDLQLSDKNRPSTGPQSVADKIPAQVIYQASVPLDDPDIRLLVGTTGLARIKAGYQPIWRRLWWSACRTFHFEM